MPRLTWKSMSAPNFNDAAYMMGSAGKDILSGITGLGAVAGQIDAGQKLTASLEQKRLEDRQYQQALAGSDLSNPNNWGRVLSAGPAGRVDDLIGAITDQSDLVTAGVDRKKTVADTGKVYADTAKTKVETQQDIFDLGVNVRTDKRSEEDRALGIKAAETVDDLVFNYASKEEAKKAIAKQDLTAKERAARYKSLEGVDDAAFTQDPEAIRALKQSDEYIAIDMSLAADEQELAVQEQMNPALGYLSAGLSAEASDGGTAGAISQFVSQKYGDDVQLYEDSPGELARTINRLHGEWKGKLPAAVVNGAIMSFVKSADWAVQGDEQLQIDEAAVNAQLSAFDSPEERQRLSDARVGFERERERLANYRAELEKAAARVGTGSYRGGKIGEQFLKEGGDVVKRIFNELAPPNAVDPQQITSQFAGQQNVGFGATAPTGQIPDTMAGLRVPTSEAASITRAAPGSPAAPAPSQDAWVRAAQEAQAKRNEYVNAPADLSQIVGDVARAVDMSEEEAEAIDILLDKVRNDTATDADRKQLERLQIRALTLLEEQS